MADIHINFINEEGEIYCRRIKNVVKYKKCAKMCEDCPFWAGFAQGQGVECEYEDPRGDSETGYRCPDSPQQEMKELIIAEAENGDELDKLIEKQANKKKGKKKE